MNKIIDARTIVDEVANEAIRIYNDYEVDIHESIKIASVIMQAKYRGYEVVEGD